MKQSIFLKEIQQFLTTYCQQERHLSRQTVLSYRDTFKLLIGYFKKEQRKSPMDILFSDLNYEMISSFLNYLEKERKVSISTRNQRLCAIKSFFKYILFKHPDYAEIISRSMNVPQKKKAKSRRAFLEPDEVTAILKSVDQTTWAGRRDYLLLDFCIRTGIRVSELVNLQRENIVFNKSPYITVMGKGRKARSVPIDHYLAQAILKWVTSNKQESHSYIFPSIRGEKMSTDAVQHLLKKYVTLAAKEKPSIGKKKISPHSLRHTTAMNLLNHGVDIQIIALWLGHEQIDTTQIYLSESMTLKKKALERTKLNFVCSKPPRPKTAISFLDDL